MTTKLTIGFLLAGITLALFWPVRHYGIVNFDDGFFVTPDDGFGGGFWRQAMNIKVSDWLPATNITFYLMHACFGFNPGAEHFLNSILHAANAGLLFLVLLKLTDATWRSAIVAAFFAWHPLRVESVAWITERKDVLYTFFMLISLLCYANYARLRSRSGYILSLSFFILSFMSKAMVVTLPFLLLLLDVWPLQRINRSTIKQIIFEKTPFFALAVLFCVITFLVNQTRANVTTLAQFGLSERLENAILSYAKYLGFLFYPSNLAIPYPYPTSFDIHQVLLCAAFIVAISALCLTQISSRPYLLVGWLWFLVTLLPVIGFVQAGDQALADRFTYVPLIGPAICLVWIVTEWTGKRIAMKVMAMVMCVIALVACIVSTSSQINYWRNSVSLFGHALSVTPENFIAECCLASGLEQSGHFRLASVQYRAALSISPSDYQSHYHLAKCLEELGYKSLALSEYEKAVSCGCNSSDYVGNASLADCLLILGRPKDAAPFMEASLKVNPFQIQELNNLAWILSTSSDPGFRNGAKAVELARRACDLTHYTETQEIGTLSAAYAEAGRFDNAIMTAKKACELARQHGEINLLENNEALLHLFEKHKPFHETASTSGHDN